MVARFRRRALLPFNVNANQVEYADWPYWVDQLTGEQIGNDADHWNDCGPACLVATRLWRTGEIWVPDQIRDTMYWDGYRGYTTTTKLVEFVKSVWQWPASETTYTFTELRSHVATWLYEKVCVIILTKEPAGYNHFTVITGMTDTGIVRYNSLGGKREELSWDELRQRFINWAVVMPVP